jgi:hypothetical protein
MPFGISPKSWFKRKSGDAKDKAEKTDGEEGGEAKDKAKGPSDGALADSGKSAPDGDAKKATGSKSETVTVTGSKKNSDHGEGHEEAEVRRGFPRLLQKKIKCFAVRQC